MSDVRKSLGAVAVLAASAVLVTPAPAGAGTFPGGNGKIAFVSDRDGNPEIYTMGADGSSPTRLTDHADADVHPAWSADGSRIAFTRFSTVVLPDGTVGRDADIYVMNADGSGLTNLTGSPELPELDPTWSPDGTRLAFTRPADENRPRIWTMNADGSDPTALTTTGGQLGDMHSSWSPDGQRVLFDRVGCTPVDHGIYAVTTDGSATVTAVSPSVERAPFQSSTAPDGGRIAYQSSPRPDPTLVECILLIAGFVADLQGGVFAAPFDDVDIAVANADGSDPTSLLVGGLLAPASALTWAPDNTRIAFARGQEQDFADADIYTVDPVTLAQTNLTGSADVSDHSPDWQPAGLSFSKTDSADPAALGATFEYTIRVRNGKPANLTNAVVSDVLPSGLLPVAAPGCTISGQRVSCNLGTVATGQTRQVTIVVEPQAAGSYANTATLRAAGAVIASATQSTVVNNGNGCTIIGTPGTDVLVGTAAADVVCGLAGNDFVLGGDGGDTGYGGSGHDTLLGQDGDDTLVGGPGYDFAQGGDGDDTIDNVDGTGGNDIADGGRGADVCTADAGPPADTRINC